MNLGCKRELELLVAMLCWGYLIARALAMRDVESAGFALIWAFIIFSRGAADLEQAANKEDRNDAR